MPALEKQTTFDRLGNILALIKQSSGEEALSQVADLIADLKRNAASESSLEMGDSGRNAQEIAEGGPEPEPWRLIASHLKAAEVQIQDTHLAMAEESLDKAIYVAGHESGRTRDAQLNV